MSENLKKRATLVLSEQELAGKTPDQIRQAVFQKLKAAFSSAPARDESYTKCAGSDVNLLSVDFGIDAEDLEH